jgi:hypothetical protein
VAILRAYFDESGTHVRSRVITIAGVVATPKRWVRLSRSWWDVLGRHGVRGEFKAAECVRGFKQYETWLPDRRDALRVALARLIDEHGLFAVGMSVPREEFEREVRDYTTSETPAYDPYIWCMRMCLETIALDPLRGSRRVACVFDAGHGGQIRAFDHFQAIRSKQRGWEKVYFASLNAAPSDEYPPLQAADLLAFELRCNADQHLHGTELERPNLAGVFKRLPIRTGYLSGAALAGFRRQLQAMAQRDTWLAWEEFAATLPSPRCGA